MYLYVIKTFSYVLYTFRKISVFWRLMCSRGIRVLLIFPRVLFRYTLWLINRWCV